MERLWIRHQTREPFNVDLNGFGEFLVIVNKDIGFDSVNISNVSKEYVVASSGYYNGLASLKFVFS